jgi:hypothetical protein
MEKLISCCGLDCAACDTRIATINDDDELRKVTADKWKVAYNAAELTPSMIYCTGCREEGVKFNHCEVCEIRNCVKARGFNTCAECNELETCKLVSMIHQHVPEALTNLRALN